MPRFTVASASASGLAGGRASGIARRSSARRQIADLKVIAHRDAMSDETPVGVKASLMRAYVDLQEIEMAIRGYGRPKPVEARNATPRAKPRKPVQPLGPAKKLLADPQAPAPGPKPVAPSDSTTS